MDDAKYNMALWSSCVMFAVWWLGRGGVVMWLVKMSIADGSYRH